MLVALLLASAAPSSSFMVPQAPLQLRQQPHLGLRSQLQRMPPACMPRSKILPSATVLRLHVSLSLLRATSDTPLPADPAELQQRLWKAADVLPDMEETQLQLAKTQETGVSDLGFVAKGPISKGDVIISVPMRWLPGSACVCMCLASSLSICAYFAR